MTKEFDLLVFVGRFQPFHMEHKRIIDIALTKSKNVLVLIGSAGKSRSIRNPFTFDERRGMIERAYSIAVDHDRLITLPLYDKTYNDVAWVKQVQDIVKQVQLNIANPTGFALNGTSNVRTGLIGASKDNSSYYLNMFPQWESVNVEINNQDMHATSIREAYFDGKFEYHTIINNIVPDSVAKFLCTPSSGPHKNENAFDKSPLYAQLKKELNFVRDYKKAWLTAPYPVKHVAVDAVVEQGGHILVVKRKAEPGKGLWAIPGGHLNEYEKLEDGAIRELREETKIKVPDPVLRGSIVASHTFDDPYRSMIGRVITQAFHIKLKGDTTLPKIKGSDDAEKAVWLPITEMKEDMFFDDHFHIINYFLGL